METNSKRVSRLPSKISFGDIHINSSLAFLSTTNLIAIVDQFNIKNGNVIILPKRKAAVFSELNESEAIDMFLFAQKIIKVMEGVHQKRISLVIRDGNAAGDLNGQSCIHLIPVAFKEVVRFEQRSSDAEIEFTEVKSYAGKLRKLVKDMLDLEENDE